jgi:hypothetical protein
MHLAPGTNNLDIVTSTGVATIALDRTLRMPAKFDAPNGNAFYKKVLATAGHVYLFDGRGVDIYSNSLKYIASVRTPGLIDVAASDSGLFTLTASLAVTAYTPDGILRSSAAITETDAQAVSINAVNTAAWASIVRGCTSGACEKKTIVFDARGVLSQTVTMTGSITDVASSGNRAYAITDLPAEIRSIDISDPAHPATIASVAADGTPASIAFANGTVYLLGNTLASYNSSTLAKTADVLGAYTSDGSTVVTGRTFAPMLLGSAAAFASPSPARSLAVQGNTFYILTDHSLEIWSDQPLPRPPRRAPAR